MTTITAIEHARLSGALKKWAHDRSFREAGNLFDFQRDDEQGSFGLQVPQNPFYTVAAFFYHIMGRPDLMRVVSTNWRCEDEVNGVYAIEDARRLYADLVRQGFKAF